MGVDKKNIINKYGTVLNYNYNNMNYDYCTTSNA